MLKRFTLAMAVGLFAGMLPQESALCADITATTSGGGTELLTVTMTGEINPGDDLIFARLTKGTGKVWLNLNSPGGDVDAAMRIGAEVRKHDGIVVTDGCYSSCVLIFAAGVIRTGVGAGFGPDPVVGVHRIFFAELQPGLTSNQIKARYDAQLSRIRVYLAKMNVAPEFLSFMQSFKPDDIHILTRQELDAYGLGSNDVVDDERMIADRAEELGISSFEYRKREKRSYEECKNADVSTMGPTAAERAESAEMGVSTDLLLRSKCALAIHYGISVDLYRQRSTEVSRKCAPYTDQAQNNRCSVHFMATGRAVP
jgi:hypothetical protein